jgi:hypothetical protein
VCKYCHQHKLINVEGSGIFKVTRATSLSAAYLGLNTRGHGYTKAGPKSTVLPSGQLSMRQVIERGVPVSQRVANAIGGFNVQRFQPAAVLWLVDNNHSLHEFETPAFRAMIEFANPEAAAALWASRFNTTYETGTLYSTDLGIEMSIYDTIRSIKSIKLQSRPSFTITKSINPIRASWKPQSIQLKTPKLIDLIVDNCGLSYVSHTVLSTVLRNRGSKHSERRNTGDSTWTELYSTLKIVH